MNKARAETTHAKLKKGVLCTVEGQKPEGGVPGGIMHIVAHEGAQSEITYGGRRTCTNRDENREKEKVQEWPKTK